MKGFYQAFANNDIKTKFPTTHMHHFTCSRVQHSIVTILITLFYDKKWLLGVKDD